MAIDCQTEEAGAFRQIIRIDAHTLHADVGAALGGQGSAPGPHDYFDASLAACKAFTATWYAKNHGIALDRVEAHIERDDSQERKGRYLLRVSLAFFGALSDADKQKLFDIASRCPVHKLMTTTEIEIESTLKP